MIMAVRCGFCMSGDHAHCPGAIDGGKTLWVCPCGCRVMRCIRCRATEDVDADLWRCRNTDDCEAAVAARTAANPVIAMVRRLTEQAHARENTERAARPVRDKGALAVAGGRCECGCGTPTKAKFAPGHDARLRGVLARAFAAGDNPAGVELACRGGLWAAKAPSTPADPNPAAFVAARVAERYNVQTIERIAK